jgi:hypothetical protein
VQSRDEDLRRGTYALEEGNEREDIETKRNVSRLHIERIRNYKKNVITSQHFSGKLDIEDEEEYYRGRHFGNEAREKMVMKLFDVDARPPTIQGHRRLKYSMFPQVKKE